jgi:hypothetical protein
LELQLVVHAFCLADDNAGNNNAARIAIIAMTTRSSINVNARRELTPDKLPSDGIRFMLLFPGTS